MMESRDSPSPPPRSSPTLHTPLITPTRKPQGVGTTLTFLNFLKGMIGPGCLSLPVAFKECGLWAGLVAIFVVGFLNFYCMRQLVHAAQFLCAKYITNFVICVMQLGIGSVLIVFMASHVQEVLGSWEKTTAINQMDTRLFMCIILLPIVLLNYIRELRVLGWLSTLGNICMLLSFFVIFFSLVTDTFSHKNNVGHLPSIRGFGPFVVGLGSMLYAFEGQAMVLPMENKMEHPGDMLGGTGVLQTSMSIVTCLYAATGLFGYTTYGNAVQGSIAQNFDNSPLYVSVKVLLIIAVYVGYGIQLYIVIEMLWPAIMRKLPQRWFEYSLLLEYIFRTALVLVTFAFAVAIPSLEDIIPLVGVTAGMILAFVVPPVLSMVTFWDEWVAGPRWRLGLFVLRDSALVLFGVAGLGAGLYVNFLKVSGQLVE